jgi:ABC-type multidrug transport system fused ATPase/permease subunit
VARIFLLAEETIWQQQKGTLMSIESWLILATVVIGILLIVGIGILEAKLTRANRIARASHDILKAMAEEQTKATAYLKYISDRKYDEASAANAANVQRSTSNRRKAEEGRTRSLSNLISAEAIPFEGGSGTGVR